MMPQEMFSESFIMLLPLIYSPLSWPYTCSPLETLEGQVFQGSKFQVVLASSLFLYRPATGHSRKGPVWKRPSQHPWSLSLKC